MDATMRTTPLPSYTVLSYDGGGVRGVMQAYISAEIEKRCDRPLAEMFDVIAGTSTGGISTLGCVTPNVDGATGTKYPDSGIDDISKELLQETTMSQALSNIAITSFEITKQRPWVFKKINTEDPTLLMRDVLRATTAAPTYFSPKHLTIGGEDLNFVDGGMFANNPTSIGWSLAASKGNATAKMILSLGTGTYSPTIKPGEADHWGAIQWMTTGGLLDTVFSGPAEAASREMRALFPGNNYVRLQTKLPYELSALDNPLNIPKLIEHAKVIVEENNEEIERICQILRTHKKEGAPQ